MSQPALDQCASSLASSLAPELVREVALQGQGYETENGAASGINIPMGGVCKLWRSAIYDDPSLWFYINIGPNSGDQIKQEGVNQFMHFLRLHLALSRDRLLHVRMSYGTALYETFWSLPETQQHFDRIASLQIVGPFIHKYTLSPSTHNSNKKKCFYLPSLRLGTIRSIFANTLVNYWQDFEVGICWNRLDSPKAKGVKVQLCYAYAEEVVSQSMTSRIFRTIRFVVQKAFIGRLGRLGLVETDDAQMYDEVFRFAEAFDPDYQDLKFSKITDIMRHIAAIPDFPADEQYDFRMRADKLVQKWQPILIGIQ